MTYVGIKPDVVLNGVTPTALRMWADVAEVYHRFGYPCVVTSALDGRHKAKSKHYVGLALDFRMHVVPNGRENELANAVTVKLGDDFDVVLEAVGEPWEHLHVEYDPE